ncbi:uncharacterized protein LOC120922644 isoform X1 [Rana temporaria]|uniref:uncharacterized protein LOC120922644 isoform X1 n=1 Tax=Rana temporaria TaxID=8407 RepID=UPI001AACF235|nr:uncharacterized protein LOC120922644 isoform X1 [Rana temporaria]
MSSLGILWLLLLQQPGAALGYVLFTHSARMGSNTTIPCKFNVNAVPAAQRTFSVLWQFQEKEIFRYPNNPGALNSRLSIDQDTIKDGIADLYMSGVSISDGGLYKCSMAQIPGEKGKEIRLDVYAPPRINIPDKNIIQSKENILSCAVSGFYPVDIDIKWLRDGIILNNITLERPQRDPGGMYSVKSSVTITPTEEDRKRIFSCRIQHESLTAPLQEDFQLVYGDTKSSTLYIIVISVIAGVVILILIAGVAIFCVKRKKGQNTGKHHEDNLEKQKESLLANNPSGLTPLPSQSVKAAGDPTPERSQKKVVSAREGTRFEEDHLPKKTQHGKENLKSVTEIINHKYTSQINDESSEAALPSSVHGPTGKSDLFSERQQSCSEESVTEQAPVYSTVLLAPFHQTSVTGPEPVPAATQSNSHITSPRGTKDLRPSIDMHTRDSGRGQAEQHHTIGNQGGENSAKSATKNWSRDSLKSPEYQNTTSFEGGSTSLASAVSPSNKTIHR